MKCYKCKNLISDQFVYCPFCGSDLNEDLINATNTAKDFYKKAQNGDAEAQNKIGTFYFQGKEGLPVNLQKAIEYYERSYKNGSLSAGYNLAVCYYRGQGVEMNKSHAKELFNYVSNKGYINASKALMKIEQEENAERIKIEEEKRRKEQVEKEERERKARELYQKQLAEAEKQRQERLKIIEELKQKEEREKLARKAEEERIAQIERELLEKKRKEREAAEQRRLEEENKKKEEEAQKLEKSYSFLIESVKNIGNNVFHDYFKKGTIIKYDDKYITIQFEEEKSPKTFSISGMENILKFEKTEKMKHYEALEANPYYRTENNQEKKYFDKVKQIVDGELKKCEDALVDSKWDYDIRDPEDVVWATEENNKAAQKRTNLNTLHGKLIESSNNPYFVRIDYLENQRSNKLYVGKHQVSDCVIDWRDKRSSIYYQYQMYISNELTKLLLMRDFDIVGGKYFGFADNYTSEEEDLINFSPDTMFDERLSELLKASRNDHNIHDIIVTISKNQYEMVTHDYNSNVLINGCAGSGKTMILFHRLAHMAFNDPEFNPKNVFVIAPNRLLLNDFNELSQILSIDKVNKYSWLNFLNFAIAQYSNKANLKFGLFNNKNYNDEYVYSTDKIAICLKKNNLLYRKVISIFQEDILLYVINLIRYFGSYSYENLNGQIKKIKREKKNKVDLATIAKYDKCIEVLELFENNSNLYKGEHQKSDDNTKGIEYLGDEVAKSFEILSRKLGGSQNAIKAIEDLYKVFDNIEDFNSILLQENYEILPSIIRYNIIKEFGIKNEDFYKSENIAFVYLSVLNAMFGIISNDKVYFCVDEYQNYSAQELMLINKLYPNVIVNYYGDPKQTLSNKGLGKNGNLNELQIEFKEFQMNENYRNAREITEYINKEFDMQMKPIGLPGSVAIKQSIESLKIDGTKRIAFVYKNENLFSEVVSNVKDLVNIIEKEQKLDRNKLNVIHISQVKGLEFEEVYVLPTDMNENEKYVAFTRALDKLFIIQK